MKQVLFTLTIISLMLSGCTLKQKEGATIQNDTSIKKHYCQTVADCAISKNDPDGFETCLNKEWLEEWTKNPEAKKYYWRCMSVG